MKKIINASFIGIVVLFLTIGLIKTVWFPEDLNELENRYANKIPDFSANAYLDGSFQSQTSDALNDQIPRASVMKKIHNYCNAWFQDRLISALLGNDSDMYISYCGGYKYKEHIINKASDFEAIVPSHDARIANIQEQVAAHPDIDFYVYYIERDTDIDFVTNERIGVYEHLEESLQSIGIPFAGFRTSSYDEYKKYFYTTDHHWNCYGAHKAYQEVLALLDVKDTPLEPVDEVLLDYDFSGAKASILGVTSIMTEKFPAYEFIYPEMDIMINGQIAEDYGKEDLYLSTKQDMISYGLFYGDDNGETILDTHNSEKENILIVGESYDNAILKLIASHYGKTFSIDLRNYKAQLGKPFAFSDYVEENDISKVLLIGSIGYFNSNEFMLED